ncbi:MAG: hypothetical protein ACREAB_17355 [Blastocatellia bacterium]
MLWQKSWWETRWRLLTILGLILLNIVVSHSWTLLTLTDWAAAVQRWWPQPQQGESGWGEKRQFLTLLSSWPGYVWWLSYPLLMAWPICAAIITTALIKSSYPLAGASGAAALYTVSLPVSRRRTLLTLAAVLASEMILLALVPSLMYAITIRLAGRWVPVGSTVIYALLLALGGMVFAAFAFLMMVILNNQWKVIAIGIFAVYTFLTLPVVLSLQDELNPFDEFPRWHIYYVMSGEAYFRYGRIPWVGLFASLAVSALMMFVAVRIYERRDF